MFSRKWYNVLDSKQATTDVIMGLIRSKPRSLRDQDCNAGKLQKSVEDEH